MYVFLVDWRLVSTTAASTATTLFATNESARGFKAHMITFSSLTLMILHLILSSGIFISCHESRGRHSNGPSPPFDLEHSSEIVFTKLSKLFLTIVFCFWSMLQTLCGQAGVWGREGKGGDKGTKESSTFCLIWDASEFSLFFASPSYVVFHHILNSLCRTGIFHFLSFCCLLVPVEIL